MPIKVIRIELKEEKVGRRRISQYTTKLIPGLLTKRPYAYGSGPMQNDNLVHFTQNTEYKKRYSPDTFKEASLVYTTSEINSKLSEINNSIEGLKKEATANINESLNSIQDALADLKKNILEDRSFKESLKSEIIEELKSQI